MDDQYLCAQSPDGCKFRACIFESKYVPLGCCRYQIDVYIPECDWWYKIEESYAAWLWDECQIHCKERLTWWAANYLDMPVAKQILP